MTIADDLGHKATKQTKTIYFIHMFICRLQIFFSKSTSLKNSFRNTIRVSNSLDPDQAGHFVLPDLGPNCLQRLSAEDTSRVFRVKTVLRQLGWFLQLLLYS